MTDDGPPWREITTADYMPRSYRDDVGGAAWAASTERVRDLLKLQHAGEFRLRLVLREAVDFKRFPGRDPRWFWNYNHGPSLVLSVAEIVVETRDGRRQRVDLRETRPDALAASTLRV